MPREKLEVKLSRLRLCQQVSSGWVAGRGREDHPGTDWRVKEPRVDGHRLHEEPRVPRLDEELLIHWQHLEDWITPKSSV